MVLYLSNIIRLSYMPCKTRNKLTMTIWWYIFMNLCAVQIKNVIMICLDLTDESVSVLTSYALSSTACYFFTNAVMYQTFEWDMLGNMILVQSKHEVRELDVVKDDYNAIEKRKIVIFKYSLWLNIFYHIIKVAVPLSTVINCTKTKIEKSMCDEVTTYRIQLMLYCDSTYATLLFIYVGFAVIKLIWTSWRYSRLEAKAHMVYFVASSLGLLTALPLILDN